VRSWSLLGVVAVARQEKVGTVPPWFYYAELAVIEEKAGGKSWERST
jgi:hypothetical protein